MRASRALSNNTFGIHAYHITAQSLSIASIATGAGAIGLGARGLSTIGTRGLSNQMGNLSLSISSAELGMRTAGYASGNDSFGNLVASTVGFGGSRILSSPPSAVFHSIQRPVLFSGPTVPDAM